MLRDELRQIRAILYKTLLIKKANMGSTLSEIFLPVAFMGLLILFKSITAKYDSPNVAYYCGQAYPFMYSSDLDNSDNLTECLEKPVDCDTDQYYQESAQFDGVKYYSQLGYTPSGINYPYYTFTVGDTAPLTNSFGYNPSLPLDKIFEQLSAHNAIFVIAPKKSGDATAVAAASSFTDYCKSIAGDFNESIFLFASEQSMENYCTNRDYDDDDYKDGKVAMAVIINSVSEDSFNWDYSIRLNFTYFYETAENSVACLYGCDYTYTIPTTEFFTFDLYVPQTADFLYGYSYSGFLTIQRALDDFIMRAGTAASFVISRPINEPIFNASLSFMPTGKFKSDDFQYTLASTLAIFYMLSFLFPVSRMIRLLVLEKELKIKEGMKMMGLSDFAYNFSWFLTLLIQMTIVTALIVATTYSSVFEYSDTALVFLYFFLFSLSIMMMCFLLATLFSKSKTSALIGSLIFFATFFPFYAVSNEQIALSTKSAACLLAPTCFALGANVFAVWEGGLVGVHADNAGDIVQNFSYNWCVAMLFVDSIIYGLLAWYLDKVFPTEYGTQLVWYFPVTKKFWFPNSGRDDDNDGNLGEKLLAADHKLDNNYDKDKFEEVSDSLKSQENDNKCVVISGLRRVFKTTAEDRVAVKHLDLSLYENQITCLLGHNGAGKSTTISMLTGLLPPTSGDAFILGKKISEDMGDIRHMLGVCPQHDILFPDLTVMQHLQMFAAFKGVKTRLNREECEKMIAEVGLVEKRDVKSSMLSGGMKRKLSLAIAMIGGSKIVILDEPTSGMDPYSRRSTWNILQKCKKGRILLLTTHFMDEADILGDRIAIMAHGVLKCCGTSLFLKNKYGVGYTFTIVKQSHHSSSSAKDPSKVITSLVRSHVPEAEILSLVGAEQSYRLPFDSSSNFVAMFKELDLKKVELEISSYGISVTTLEEVFMRVGRGVTEDVKQIQDNRDSISRLKETRDSAEDNQPKGMGSMQIEEDKKNASRISSTGSSVSGVKNVGGSETGSDAGSFQSVALGSTHVPSYVVDHSKRDVSEVAAMSIGNTSSIGQSSQTQSTIGGRFYDEGKGRESERKVFAVHFAALFRKRYLYSLRDKKMFMCQLILPCILVLFGQGILLAQPDTNQPSLLFKGTKFNQDIGKLHRNYVPFQSLSSDAELVQGQFDMESVLGMSVNVSTESDQFAGCAQGSTELGRMANYMISDDPDLDSEKGSSRYGAYTATGDLPSAASPSTATFSYNAFVNGSGLHGAGVYMNLMSTAIFQVITGNDDADIITHNHPLPRTYKQQEQSASVDAFTASMFFMIASCFIPTSYAIFVVREREVKAKHQQVISGVGMYAYWMSTFMWDAVSYLLPFICIVSLVFAFNVEAYTQNDGAVAMVLLFLFFGPASASFTYSLTFLFTSHSTAQNIVLFLNFVTGLCLMVVSFVLTLIPSTVELNYSLRYFYRLFPGFCLGDGLLQVALCQDGQYCPRITTSGYSSETVSPLSWDTAGADIFFLAIEAVLYFLVTLLIEYSLQFPSFLQMLQRVNDPGDAFQIQDEDVVREHDRVITGGADNDVVRLVNLRKVYSTPIGPKVAVRHLTFGIPKGECFGFLGINGAGKTTTLSILSGEFPPTSGTAFIANFDIREDQTKIRRKIGYCPQFDALLDLLTVREHLELYARIKGVPKEEMEEIVMGKLVQMDLSDFENIAAGSLSGGNKRKLSVAIALIADPPIVFLDEPSTGMDPVSRRFMWDVISKLSTQEGKCSIILTTHAMEECEALCSRIGIMVNGMLQCLGPATHLKTRFGSGYEVDVRTHRESLQEIINIFNNIPTAIVQSLGRLDLRTGTSASVTSDETGGKEDDAVSDVSSSEETVLSLYKVRIGDFGTMAQVLSDMSKKKESADMEMFGGNDDSSSPTRMSISELVERRISEINATGSGQAIFDILVADSSTTGDGEGPKSDGGHRFAGIQPTAGVPLRAFIEWWLAEDKADWLINRFVPSRFDMQASKLLERSSAYNFRFRLGLRTRAHEVGGLADVFEIFENAKCHPQSYIKEYSVGQTTLEQIFNHFASQQSNPEVQARN